MKRDPDVLVLRLVLTLAAIALFVIFFGLEAQAHTDSEIKEWEEQWKLDFNTAFNEFRYDFSLEAMFKVEVLRWEKVDFINRHTCHYQTCAVISVTVADNVYRGMGTDVERWRGLVSAYFTNVDAMLCIMAGESGGNPNAINQQGSGAAGLFQVMPFWWAAYGGNRYDPEDNTSMAALIYSQQGYAAWPNTSKACGL